VFINLYDLSEEGKAGYAIQVLSGIFCIGFSITEKIQLDLFIHIFGFTVKLILNFNIAFYKKILRL